jgi:hypothetical protein
MTRILNNNKALVFIIGILIIANIAILAFFLSIKPPQKKEGNNSNDKVSVNDFLKKDIKFSKEQMKQFDSLKKVHWKVAKPLFKGMTAVKDSFYIHISDSVVNDQFLLETSDSIAMRQKQLDLQMFAHFRNIRKLCTADQKPLYDSLVQDVIRKMMNPYRKDSRPKTPDTEKKTDSGSVAR